MREYLPMLVGNRALRERLGAELSRGALAHAYILEGPRGCGKHTLAREIAMALACEHRTDASTALPCGECAACRKIAAGNSPDVLTVSRPADKATMGVDVIRALRTDVSVVPNDLDVKIYIIEDAHTMTEQAQNALLLTLEEPPPFVVFLLLANEADALLETIRSRAPTLRLQPVDEEELSAYLLSPARKEASRAARALQEQAPAEYTTLLRMANGCIGRALELLEEKTRAPQLARREDAKTLCALLSQGRQPHALLALLRGFGTSREELTARLLFVNEALRDLAVLCHSDTAPLIFYTDREQALELSARFTARELFSFIEATNDTLATLAANGNTRLAMAQYLCRLAA